MRSTLFLSVHYSIVKYRHSLFNSISLCLAEGLLFNPGLFRVFITHGHWTSSDALSASVSVTVTDCPGLFCFKHWKLCVLGKPSVLDKPVWLVTLVSEMIMWFLPFITLVWCIILIDFEIINQPCIPEINLTWLWCIILYVAWFSLLTFSETFLWLCLWDLLVWSFLFLWCLWIRKSNTNLIEWIEKCSLYFLCKSFWRIGIMSLNIFGKIHQIYGWKHLTFIFLFVKI